MDLRDKVRSIKDFPKEGIIFRDVTTIFKDPQAFHQLMDEMAATLEGQKIDVVIGPEARGFTVASVLAYMLHAGFVPVRKPGKLPREVRTESYELEYGTDELQMHVDALDGDDVVLIIDDLVATGGTAVAQAKLVSQYGCKLAGMGFLMELEFLHPREAIAKETDVDVFALVQVK